MSRRTSGLIVLWLCLGAAALAAGPRLPVVRFASRPPFSASGEIPDVWRDADRLCGFVVPGGYAVETFATEAAMLFDDADLHILLKAHRDLHYNGLAGGRKGHPGNNFEVFLSPDDGRSYRQIIVSESGACRTAKAIDGRRGDAPIPGLRTAVGSGWKTWHALVSLPLSSLGLKAPGEGGAALLRFNICRRNLDLPPQVKDGEASSFSVLPRLNYHQPETWSKAVLDRGDRNRPAVIRPWQAGNGAPIDLIPNSGFVLGRPDRLAGWHFLNPRDIVRQETSEFSGKWILRCTGRSYQVASVLVPGLVAGETYTFRIKAGSFGETNAIGILPFISEPSDPGKFGTGQQIAWKFPISRDRDAGQEYTIPFVMPDRTIGFSFYRFGPPRQDAGLDYQAIRLYRGRLSSFEIRRIERPPRKKPVPGTALPPPPGIIPPGGERYSVLAICEEPLMIRDVMGLFSGLNVRYDCITTTGKDTDIYYTDDDPREIQARLEKNAYDLYLACRNAPRIGKGLAAHIAKNVEAGAGLALCNPPSDCGNLAGMLRQATPRRSLAGCLAGEGGPFDLLSVPRPDLVGLQEFSHGRGRIVVYHTNRNCGFLFQDLPYGTANPFPYVEHTNAFLARLCRHAAGRLPRRFLACTSAGAAVRVRCAGVPDGTPLKWTLLAKDGRTEDAGECRILSGKAEIAPAMTRRGKHLLCMRLTEEDDRTLDYAAISLAKDGPGIEQLKDARTHNDSASPAEIAYAISGLRPGMSLAWTLEDFSGRILEQGEAPAAAQGGISPPLAALFTNYARFTLDLKQDGRILDSRRIPVYVQDLDRKRLLNDFTPCIWPYEPYVCREFQDSLLRRMEDIGIRSQGFMWGTDISEVLARGQGLAAGGAISGAVFHGRKQDGHVRKQQCNTARAHRELAGLAYDHGRRTRHLGVISNNLCDEVSLCRNGSADELDAHPENLAEYRRRMQAKYGTIERFNQACGSAYPDFAGIGQALLADARRTGRFAEFIEWRNFNTDRWCEIIRIISEQARRGDPDSLFALPNTFGQGALGANDYWRLLTRCGLGFSHEYTSMVYMGGMENPSPIHDFDELYRSFAPKMRVWGYMGYINDEARLRYQPWWFALHRYGGLSWFSATSFAVRSGGQDSAWNLVDVPGNALTVDAAQLKESLDGSRLLQGMGRLLLEYRWIPNDIAIYYSHNSLLVSFCLGKETREGEIGDSGPVHDFYFSRHNLRYLLENQLYQYDFVSYEQVEKGLLSGRKALFMPGIVSLSDREVSELGAFLERGGVIVADRAPGAYDELGRRRPVPPLSGRPGVVLLESIFDGNDRAQVRRIRGILAKAGAEPVLGSDREDLAPGREAMHFRDGDMHVFAVIRHPLKATGAGTQRLTFPIEGHVYDLLRGRYLGKGNHAETALDGKNPAAVFGVYPSRPRRLRIDLPRTVRRGHDLAARIRVVSGVFRRTGKHVLHVEVARPGVQPRFFMARNLPAPAGRAEFRFRMAFNDPRGGWVLRVRDVLTGLTAEHPFVLE